jgi:5-hydroxyisourate hydrolase
MGITTHILDVARGRPAAGVAVTLERQVGQAWEAVGSGTTDADGRCRSLTPAERGTAAGTYRIGFATGEYFTRQGTPGFYPQVSIEFLVAAPGEHYHVPLLLSPFGFSTYRGS